MTRNDTLPLTSTHWGTFARFYAPGDWIDRSLHLSLPNDETHEGHTVDLRFFDKEKNTVRGIDRQIPVHRASMPFDAR